ncbi:MAG: hypothetical protein EP325_17415 [Vibrionaceae bacterium]|nr:MAG: hypothetical protein EP325_17415 [Vibrionaceae bacterium]
MNYPYTDDDVLLCDAIAFIARAVYPEERDISRTKRVRARVDYAVKQGEIQRLRRDGGDRVNAIEFFTWAAASRGWSCLYQITDIPIRPASASVNVVTPSFVVRAVGTAIPPDREQLEQAYRELNVRFNDLQQDNERLLKENSDLTGEVEYWRAKHASESAKKSAAAKKPRPR